MGFAAGHAGYQLNRPPGPGIIINSKGARSWVAISDGPNQSRQVQQADLKRIMAGQLQNPRLE